MVTVWCLCRRGMSSIPDIIVIQDYGTYLHNRGHQFTGTVVQFRQKSAFISDNHYKAKHTHGIGSENKCTMKSLGNMFSRCIFIISQGTVRYLDSIAILGFDTRGQE